MGGTILRFGLFKSSLQAAQKRLPIQGHAELIINDIAAEKVDDDEQVHEALSHTNEGDIHCPDLIRMRDLESPQKVWAHILGVKQLAQIGPGADAMDVHDPHQSSDPLPVDGSAGISHIFGDPAVAIKGLGRIDLIDQAHV